MHEEELTTEEQAEFEVWFLDLARRNARVQDAPNRLRALSEALRGGVLGTVMETHLIVCNS